MPKIILRVGWVLSVAEIRVLLITNRLMPTLPKNTGQHTMANEDLFLDTSGLLCLFDVTDLRRQKANEYFRQAKSLLTTNYVLAEFVPLTHVRGLKRENALNFSNTLILLPRLKLVWVDERLHLEAMALLARRLDKTYSLCDAVSFVAMRERACLSALTTDKHFEQEGFIRLLGN